MYAYERVDEDLLDADDEVTLYNGKPFSGVGFYAFADRQGIEYETEYVNGLIHGVDRKWHKNGKLAYEVPCCYGIKHGKEMHWFHDGTVKSTINYEFGVKIDSMVWNEAGKLLEHVEISPGSTNFAILQNRRKKGWDFPSF